MRKEGSGAGREQHHAVWASLGTMDSIWPAYLPLQQSGQKTVCSSRPPATPLWLPSPRQRVHMHNLRQDNNSVSTQTMATSSFDFKGIHISVSSGNKYYFSQM